MPLMPGMSMASYPPTVAVTLFYRALLAVAIVLALVVVLTRPWIRRMMTPVGEGSEDGSRWRNIVAYWLGALWLLDGLLQMQPQMVTRFIGGFLAPLLGGQPDWARTVIEAGIRMWSASPIWFNVAAAFIQMLVGIILLFTRDGAPLRRVALYVSLGWGLMVWSAGEAFGSLFNGGGPLVGSPGSVFLYIIAAVLLLLPARVWAGPVFWRWMHYGMGAYFALLAFLAAWPANGWWVRHGSTYVLNMAQMPQPNIVARPLYAYAASYAAHPALWNGLMVATSVGLAVAWLVRPRRWLVWVTAAWTLLVWYFGTDFGVLGGMGTDPQTGAIFLPFLVAWGVRLGARARVIDDADATGEAMLHSPR